MIFGINTRLISEAEETETSTTTQQTTSSSSQPTTSTTVRTSTSLDNETKENLKLMRQAFFSIGFLKANQLVGPKWANTVMDGLDQLATKYMGKPITTSSTTTSVSSDSKQQGDSGNGGKIVEGKIGNFDVDKACQWILSNTTPSSCRHNCAGVVEDAMQQGGLERPHCSDNNAPGNKASNLHHYNILADRGWKCIAQGKGVGNKDTESGTDIASKVPGGLQKGDVAVIGWKETPPGRSFHATMWTGNKWVSDFQQQNCIPYGKTEYPYYIYRYSGSGGTSQEMAMKKGGGTQQQTTVQQNGGVTYA